MLQTHNEIVFFLLFAVALSFFVFVSAFFSFCFFLFFFRIFWFLFNYRIGVVNLHTVECGNVHKAILYFFYGKYDVTVMTILKRMFKGQQPEFWRKYRTVLF